MVFRTPQVVLWVESAMVPGSAELARWDGRDQVLQVRGYAEAVGMMSEYQVDVVLATVGEDADQAERFVRWLKSAHPHVPVVVAANRHSRQIEKRLRQWPVAAYLARPVEPRLLADLLEQLRWLTAVRRTQAGGQPAVIQAG